MHIAIALTLFFASATSLLGARRNAQLARATGKQGYWAGVAIAVLMAAWMAFCGIWLLMH
jgi:Na+-driven multidrug efflux pump